MTPSPAQTAWLQLGYGLFMHFGPNTFAGKPWGDGQFPAADVDLSRVDTRQWARVAAEAGMKYAVLTSKHHDGYCLWPSKHTEYGVRHSPGARDVVGDFVSAFRREGLKVGLYYSLWDRNCPVYEDDAAYAQFMRDQLTELLSGYGDIAELWFDGGWDKEHPTRSWEFDPAWLSDPRSGYNPGLRWEWRKLYALIHQLQPNIMVLNNSSSDRPGVPRYFPIDARTSEHFDFVFRERLYPTDTRAVWTDDQGRDVFLPLEFDVDVNNARWFWNEGAFTAHPSADTLASWHRRARAAGANLLVNVGPNRHGVIPEYHRPFLVQAAKQLFG